MSQAIPQIPGRKEQLFFLPSAPYGERREQLVQSPVLVASEITPPFAQTLRRNGVVDRIKNLRLLLQRESVRGPEVTYVSTQKPNRRTSAPKNDWKPASKRDAEILENRYQKKQAGITPNERDIRLVRAGLATVLEFLPVQILGFWGVGDIITLLEATAGYSIDLVKLTRRERLICLGAALLPVIPARPIVAFSTKYEDKQYEQYRKMHPPVSSSTIIDA